MEDLIKFLKKFSSSNTVGAIFASPCTDTIKSSQSGKTIDATVERTHLWQAQTPQIFEYEALESIYKNFTGDLSLITDESSMFEDSEYLISIFQSSNLNIKGYCKRRYGTGSVNYKKYYQIMRIGQGYDAHKLIAGDGIILGGIKIDCDFSIEAYSDGDILVHALIDALLGAASYGDLGTFFPSNDINFKDISSIEMLKKILNKLEKDNYYIINVDLTYIGSVPNLSKFKENIRKNLSSVLKITKDAISCKATTTDGLGFEGKKEGVSSLCVVLIDKK